MPFKPCRQCTVPGCPSFAVSNSGWCDVHARKARNANDRRRGKSTERGYDASWRRVRALKLAADPLCEECLNGLTGPPRDVVAVLVHHIKPVEQYPELRLDMENLQSLCNMHHELIHRPDRWSSKPPS